MAVYKSVAFKPAPAKQFSGNRSKLSEMPINNLAASSMMHRTESFARLTMLRESRFIFAVPPKLMTFARNLECIHALCACGAIRFHMECSLIDSCVLYRLMDASQGDWCHRFIGVSN